MTEQIWPTKAEIKKARIMGKNYAAHEIQNGAEKPQAKPLSAQWSDGPTDVTIAFGVDYTHMENLEGVAEIGNAWEAGYFKAWRAHRDAQKPVAFDSYEENNLVVLADGSTRDYFEDAGA